MTGGAAEFMRAATALAMPARRRALLRGLRRQILALDRESDFPGFLLETARYLVAGTKASACGVVARFPDTAQDLLVLVIPGQEPLQRVVPIESGDVVRELLSRGEYRDGSGFFHSGFTSATALVPPRVLVAGVTAPGRRLMEVELANPDPRIIPDAATLGELVAEVGAAFELAYLYDRLRRERLEARMLLQVGQELGRTLDVKELLNSVLDRLMRVVPYDAAAIYLLGEDSLDVVHQTVRGYGEGKDEFVRLQVGQGLVGWVARTGEPLLVPDVRRDPRYYAARPETASELVVPLASGGRVFGVFNVENNRPHAYTPHHVQLLTTFAVQAGAALERARLLEAEKAKRRLEQEVQIARRIQRSFVPRPGEAMWRRGLAARMVPSREVSGDYYDFVERKDGLLAVALADVAGKGVPAALIMASLRSAFRHALATPDPAQLCRELNDFLHASLEETEFVTGVFGYLDPVRRRFHYCNAGHNAPVLLRELGRVELLETGGPLLGVFPGADYETATVELGRSDLLVLYTDGVTEAFLPEKGEFGLEGLIGVVRAQAASPPQDIVNAVVQAVRSFVGGPPADDLTLVLISGTPERPA